MASTIASPSWEFEIAEPFVLRAARIGKQAGARRLGASLYELGPGAVASPLHLHHGNEELLVVLSGAPSLRRLEGSEQLSAGDVVSFPAGPEGAHRVENHSSEPVRVLIISTMNFPDIAEHPDSDKLLLLIDSPQDGGEVLAFHRSAAVHPLEGEHELTAVSRQPQPDHDDR